MPVSQPPLPSIDPAESAKSRKSWGGAWAFTAATALILVTLTIVLALREGTLAQQGQSQVAATGAEGAETSRAPAAGLAEEEPTASTPAGLISPQEARNGLIAFVSDRDGNDEIYVMQPDGSGQTRITNDSSAAHLARDLSPVWSADGRILGWYRIEDSNDNGEFDDAEDVKSIHLVLDESELDQCVERQPRSAEPCGRAVFRGSGGWLMSAGADSDLSHIVLHAVLDENANNELGDDDPRALALLETSAARTAEPEDLENLLDGLDGYAPSDLQAETPILWAPAEPTVYVMLIGPEGEGLYALSLDLEARTVADSESPALLVEGRLRQAALSADGKRLAYWKEFEDTGRTRRRMFVHDLDSGLETTLLMGGLGLAFVDDLQWSNDGSRLLFMGGTGNSAPEIYSLDVTADALTSLTRRIADPAFTPAWSPDNRLAAFVVQSYRATSQGFQPSGDANLFVTDDLGAAATQLTQGQGNNTQPAWQPIYAGR